MGCGSRGFFYYQRPVIREVPNENQNHTKKEDPLEILKMRFANGEISVEEYNRMKQVLLGNDVDIQPIKQTSEEKVINDTPKSEGKSTQRPKVSLKKS